MKLRALASCAIKFRLHKTKLITKNMPSPSNRHRLRIAGLTILELTLLLLWTLWIGRAYLDMSADHIPYGREFGMSIHPHYIWTQLGKCGACVFWNGYFNGGFPAFAELHAGVLHPLVIIATLIWGGLNGGKIVLIGSLMMAGIAQWWLARTMNVGFLARMWSAMMAVAGGHLASRMELGVTGVVLSTAACSLVLPPIIKLAQRGQMRDVVGLALMLALAIVSGQGYLQLGLAVSILPALLILWVDDDLHMRPVWKKFFLAGLLALLLAGIFLVPLAHFWPEFGKDGDMTFSTYQPLAYIPLNLVISDIAFYESPILHKIPYIYINSNYIGWIPVLLALLSLRLTPQNERRRLIFFCIAIGLTWVAASGSFFRALATWQPEFAEGIRNPGLIAGLAVPLMLGLAATSVDKLWQLNWPVLLFTSTDTSQYTRFIHLSGRITLMGILLTALLRVYDYGQQWLTTVNVDQTLTTIIDATKTDDAQWINLPFGEHFWVPAAAAAGMKLSPVSRPSFWLNRREPGAFLEATRGYVKDTNPYLLQVIDGVKLIRHVEHNYAYVVTKDGDVKVPCRAAAQGGNIDVICQTGEVGTLIVEENRWSGWFAWRDGQAVKMNQTERWLNAFAPAGEHTYRFRYRPWDVVLGTAVSLIGLYLAIIIWLRDH